MGQLQGVPDKFGGVIVKSGQWPSLPDEFATLLKSSLPIWEEQSFRLAWLTIPIENANLVPVAVSTGFIFHSCTDNQITLVSRLAEEAFIPPAATHFVGVGAVVLSENNELLVVIEKQERRTNFYKLPGGLLNVNEHIADGIVREVLEETGVRTQFVSLLCLGQLHRWQFGKSNIYFVCRLLPLTDEIIVDETEIARAVWLPLDDYLNSAHVGVFNKQVVASTLKITGLKAITGDEFEADPVNLEVYLP
jgi:ADP-ribose pyrophosphatase YjhB (NUDIX family)